MEEEIKVDRDGTIRWYVVTPDGRHMLHRNGEPAVIREDGRNEWFQYGQLHREDGPALEDVNGRGKYALLDTVFDTREEYESKLKLFRTLVTITVHFKNGTTESHSWIEKSLIHGKQAREYMVVKIERAMDDKTAPQSIRISDDLLVNIKEVTKVITSVESLDSKARANV